MKTAPDTIVTSLTPEALKIGQAVEAQSNLMMNAIVRKFRVKLVSRTGLRLLPVSPLTSRRKGSDFKISFPYL
jgi:tubulin-specific chaperone D